MEIILPLLCLLLFALAGLVIILLEYRDKDYTDRSVMVMIKNNERTCEGTVRQLFSSKVGKDSSFLIIDDHSTDKTGEIIKCLARKRSNVELIFRDNLTQENYYRIKSTIPHTSLVLDLREKICA